MINLYIEEEGSHSQAEKIDQLIIRWKSGHPTMFDLRRRATHHPFVLDFCIDWLQLYDYMFYIKAKSIEFIYTRTQFKAITSEQAREYEFQLPLFEENGSIKEYMTVMAMIHAIIAEQLCPDDPHSLKTGKQMTGGMRLADWCKEMVKTNKAILEHLLSNEGALQTIDCAIKNVKAFMGDDFEAKIATNVQVIFPQSPE